MGQLILTTRIIRQFRQCLQPRLDGRIEGVQTVLPKRFGIIKWITSKLIPWVSESKLKEMLRTLLWRPGPLCQDSCRL